jgi:parvulin-like peptidyl-prolyl isomerase
MFPEFKVALEGASVDTTVGPVGTDFGWHILRVLDRREQQAFTLAGNFDAIKEMARREKTNTVVSDWIAGIRKETYVDVRTVKQHEEITP